MINDFYPHLFYLPFIEKPHLFLVDQTLSGSLALKGSPLENRCVPCKWVECMHNHLLSSKSPGFQLASLQVSNVTPPTPSASSAPYFVSGVHTKISSTSFPAVTREWFFGEGWMRNRGYHRGNVSLELCPYPEPKIKLLLAGWCWVSS